MPWTQRDAIEEAVGNIERALEERLDIVQRVDVERVLKQLIDVAPSAHYGRNYTPWAGND